MTIEELLYHCFQLGQITLDEYLKYQELPLEELERIRKVIKKHETDRE